MNRKKLFNLAVVFGALAFVLVPVSAYAFDFDPFGITGAGFIDPTQHPASLLALVVNLLLGLVGLVFLILIIYAGFMMAFSDGNEDKFGKARKIITTAVIGLVITLAASGIAFLVFSYLPVGDSDTSSNGGDGSDNQSDTDCVKLDGQCYKDPVGSPDPEYQSNGCPTDWTSLDWKGCGWGYTCCKKP